MNLDAFKQWHAAKCRGDCQQGRHECKSRDECADASDDCWDLFSVAEQKFITACIWLTVTAVLAAVAFN